MVSNLLVDSAWDEEALMHLFLQDEVVAVKKVYCIRLEEQDVWVWYANKNGCYLVKSRYHLLVANLTITPIILFRERSYGRLRYQKSS